MIKEEQNQCLLCINSGNCFCKSHTNSTDNVSRCVRGYIFNVKILRADLIQFESAPISRLSAALATLWHNKLVLEVMIPLLLLAWNAIWSGCSVKTLITSHFVCLFNNSKRYCGQICVEIALAYIIYFIHSVCLW